MELHNKTLIQEIESWKSEFPYLNSFFELSIIKGFIAIADIIPNKDKYQKLIVNYVSGLIDLFIYFQTKNEDYLEEFDLKTKDYFKIVLKIVNSKNYQNYLIDKSIPVSRTLLIDGINLVIKDEIKIHIQRNNVMPLTSNDLDSLETDLINFSRKKYQKYAPKQKEAIVTTIDSEKTKPRFNLTEPQIKGLHSNLINENKCKTTIENFEAICKGAKEFDKIEWTGSLQKLNAFCRWLTNDLTRNPSKGFVNELFKIKNKSFIKLSTPHVKDNPTFAHYINQYTIIIKEN